MGNRGFQEREPWAQTPVASTATCGDRGGERGEAGGQGWILLEVTRALCVSPSNASGHFWPWFQNVISQQKEKIVLLSKCSYELSPP